jgi:signal transduction histidine kinase
MKKGRLFFVVAVCAVAIFCLSQSAFSADFKHAPEDKARAEKAVQQVNKAIEYIQKNGQDAAVKAFHDLNSGFIDGEYFIFYIKFDGTYLAHGKLPVMDGKNIFNIKDPDGKYLIRDMVEIVKGPGSGWYSYKWNNPDTKSTEFKISYAKRVPNTETFVGCGYHKKL